MWLEGEWCRKGRRRKGKSGQTSGGGGGGGCGESVEFGILRPLSFVIAEEWQRKRATGEQRKQGSILTGQSGVRGRRATGVVGGGDQ